MMQINPHNMKKLTQQFLHTLPFNGKHQLSPCKYKTKNVLDDHEHSLSCSANAVVLRIGAKHPG